MNKKFSTFLCAVMLILSAFTAKAADITGYTGPTGAHAVAKLDEAALKGIYQLRSDDGKVLVIENGKYIFQDTTALTHLQNSLWCITITEQGNGKEPIYDFINKGTGELLSIDEVHVKDLATDATTAIVGGMPVGENYGGWAFSDTYKTELKADKPMFTYVEADYVLLLVKDSNNELQVMKKFGAEAARAEATGVKMSVYDAGAYVLSAAEINAYLSDNKNVLTFTPDAVADVNYFTSTKFTARGMDHLKTNADHNFVYVTQDANSKKYLKVDTAANTTGTAFLKFAWTDTTAVANFSADTAATGMLNQHKFLFTYKPSVDSLFIQVKRARYKNEEFPERWWSQVTDIKNYGETYVGVDDTNDALDAAADADCYPSYLFVKLQDFTVANKIVTIGRKPINTHIGFGLKSCNVTSDKTSLENGLYIIKNAKGQVLAAPIHKNSNFAGNTDVEWVTLDAQDPLHMPAYQWVITKTLNSEISKPTSPITIINREFPSEKFETVQLRLNGNAIVISGFGDLNTATKFEKVTDAAILGDKKLGYKHIKSMDLMVTKYKFNYLNPFSMDYWIANGAGNYVYVKKDANEYQLEEGSTATYGIDVTADLRSKIPGLAQLERTNYVIAKDKNNRLVQSTEDKFAMGAKNVTNNAVDTFFFKENNHYEGAHFYAIVESYYVDSLQRAILQHTDTTTKVGIADDGMQAPLKVQRLNETRTSAFTVEESITPLYRRFDSKKLEGNTADASDTIRFYENYRSEYLQIEANKNFTKAGIDFLGIDAPEKATSGLAFIVDTAWVNRGYGYIKPQYLISIERNDFGGSNGEPCTEPGPHIDINGNFTDDPAQCVHGTLAVPGFQRGKYLINFHNFAAYNNETYTWKKYDRAGFVDAIRRADTLYILRDQFKNLENNKINFDAIKAAEATAATKANYVPHIYRLDGDQHKYVTWSMRFKNRAVAANEEEADRAFLIESMKDCVTRPDGTSPIYPVNGSVGNDYINAGDIAPLQAAWLKMQNGCLVLSTGDSNFDEMTTGSDDALIFNVKYKANDEIATDAEVVTAATVSVVAGEGVVTVKGAADKKVVISNVLGQTIANTTLSSDNVTIAAPAGLVVVSVEGEAAVKAIVK